MFPPVNQAQNASESEYCKQQPTAKPARPSNLVVQVADNDLSRRFLLDFGASTARKNAVLHDEASANSPAVMPPCDVDAGQT